MNKAEFNQIMGAYYEGFNVDEYRILEYLQFSTTQPKTVDGVVVPTFPPRSTQKGTFAPSASMYTGFTANVQVVDGVLKLSYPTIEWTIRIEMGILICEMRSIGSTNRFMAQGYSREEAEYAARVIYYYQHIGALSPVHAIDIALEWYQGAFTVVNKTQMAEREVFICKTIEKEASISLDGHDIHVYMQQVGIPVGKTVGWSNNVDIHISRHVQSLYVQACVGDPSLKNWRYAAFEVDKDGGVKSIQPLNSLKQIGGL
jgi:hypothetical protein